MRESTNCRIHRRHGLLQSLVVRKAARGKHAVVAGRRRLMAFILAKDGRIEADMPVPCHVIDGDADAAEISLAENVMREAMHPADEFEAFRDLADKGLPAAEIAARFGVTETVVAKRLKLANVSPLILKTYRRATSLSNTSWPSPSATTMPRRTTSSKTCRNTTTTLPTSAPP